MKKRSQRLIDKEFQLKKSFAVIGLVSVFMAVIIISVGMVITLNNNKIRKNNLEVESNTESIKKIMDLQQSVFINLSLKPSTPDGKMSDHRFNELLRDYNTAIDKLYATISSNDTIFKSNSEIMEKNKWLMVTVLVVFILGLSVLYIQLIKYTHRISGPIYLMSKYIKEILEDKKPDMRNLRDKDDFKEFYGLLRQMVERFFELKQKTDNPSDR